MRSHKAILFIFSLVAACAVVIAVSTTRNQAVGHNDKATATKPQRKDLPVVDFNAQANTPASITRRAKNRRYDLNDSKLNRARFELKESDPEELYELTPAHAPKKSAIPAARSDLVVIGQVVSSEAHLSNDKSNVYTELNLQVAEVLKNTSGQGVFPGSSIATERSGGAVRFSSGKILRRGHLQETMPLPGERYIFFLRSFGDTEGFFLITGYNLREGHVFPLDGVRTMEGSARLPQFAAYDGVEEEAFLNQVRTALAARVQTERLVRLVNSTSPQTELSPNFLPVDDDPPDPPDPDPGATPTPCAPPAVSANGRLGAWPQNTSVSVYIQTGPGHFTEAEAACLTTAFNNWNGGAGAGGNASGVRFNVTRSATAHGTMSSNGGNPSTGGLDNIFQVSRGAPSNPLGVAITGGQANSGTTARGNAVTLIHPQVGTDASAGCEALTETMAHEIGHTFGLGECQTGSGTCNQPGTSVMNGAPCGTRNAEGVCTAPAYNDTSRGTPGPTNCDNTKAKEIGQYNPATTNQPAPAGTGTGGGGGGGGDGGGGGGGGGWGCTPYYWVYYESYDNGETWWEVDRWYAGCW